MVDGLYRQKKKAKVGTRLKEKIGWTVDLKKNMGVGEQKKASQNLSES